MFTRSLSSEKRSFLRRLLQWALRICGLALWMGILFVLYQRGSSFETLLAEEKEPSQVFPVLAVSAEKAPSSREIRFFGVTRSVRQAIISPLVGGKLEKRLVSVGDFVHAREEIARIEPREYTHLAAMKKAFLQEAKARLRQGESNLKRMQGLYKDQVVSPQQMEQEETSFQVLQAQCHALESELAEARRKLEETRIYAPFDGVVTRIYAEPGEYLSPGTPLVELANRSVELHVSIPESLLGSVKPGEAVGVIFPLLEHRSIEGTVVSLGDALGDDQKGALFPVSIRLPQEVWLRSGMTAEAVFTSPLEGDFLVPVTAICNGDGKEDSLFVVRQGIARKIPVLPREILGDSVAISGALEEGEMVVVGGHAFLGDGDSVEVRSWKGL